LAPALWGPPYLLGRHHKNSSSFRKGIRG